jgi:hypothetical protein
VVGIFNNEVLIIEEGFFLAEMGASIPPVYLTLNFRSSLMIGRECEVARGGLGE